MSIYQGDTKISGNAMMVALPMFFATYQPRKLNNPSWLRAEPYSWHSADLYVSAYAHLVDGFNNCAKLHSWVNNGVYYWTTSTTPSVGDAVYGGYPRAIVGTVQAVGNNTITYNNTVYTLDTTYIYGFQEQIAGTTITFYKLSDEIKVVLPDQQTNLDTIYNATGIGYYFVLDTANRQFKLPRNTYGFTGYRGDVGGYVAPGLPNITGKFTKTGRFVYGDKDNGAYYNSGALYGDDLQSDGQGCTQYGNGTGLRSIAFNAALSNSIYGASNTVQPPATQAYLYFYVGNTVQNETLADVGEMSEAINDKVDLTSSWGAPSSNVINFSQVASNDTLTMPADGYMTAEYTGTQDVNNWCELIVGGRVKQGTYTRAANWMAVTIPVRQGDVVIVGYNIGASGTFRRLTFTYAQKTN